MAEVVLFRHLEGLTDGVRAFAKGLSVDGHAVHTPDLFDGERLATIDDGIATGRPHTDPWDGKRPLLRGGGRHRRRP